MSPRTAAVVALLGLACGEEPETSATPDAVTGDARAAPQDAGSSEDDAAPSGPPDSADTVPPGPVDPGLGALQCPPHGPFGPEIGDTLANVALADCDGRPYALHDLCPHDVSYVFGFAGWCPPCRAYAAEVGALYAAQVEHGDFAMFFVVTETDDGDPADATFCRTIRDQYRLEMPVLFQPEGQFPTALGVPPNEVHFVMGRGNELLWYDHYGAAGVEAALEAAWETAATRRGR